MMNKDIARYLKKCKKVFPFFKKSEKFFYEKFKESVNLQFEENNNITYQELVEKFGTPKEIMISYIHHCDDDYIIYQMNLKKYIRNLFICLSLILIIMLSSICYLEYKTIEETKEQDIITEEITLEQN